MPTPSDSTDELLIPSQIEHLLHSTCPPEVDRPAEWRAQVLDRLSRAGSQSDAAMNTSAEDENASQAQTHIAEDDDSGLAATGTQDAHPEKADHAAAMCIGSSPSMSSSDSPPSFQVEERQVEDAEEERHLSTASPSSILDLPYSNRLGLHSSRVCTNTA